MADLQMIGNGGTHRVYLHPLFPGSVIKFFIEPPTAKYLDTLLDNKELAAFLVANVETVELTLQSDVSRWRERILLQPWCAAVATGTSINVSYWELRPDVVPVPKADATADIFEQFLEIEPAGKSVLEICHEDAHFKNRLAQMYRAISAYLQRTRAVVDFVGSHNFVAFRDEGWEVEVIDCLKGDRVDAAAIWRNGTAEAPALQYTTELLNVCAFFRMIVFVEHLISDSSISDQFSNCWKEAFADLKSGFHDDNFEVLRR